MRKTYDKLIRDRIPEIMDEAGVKYELETMTSEAYKRALKNKLVEEAKEVADAPDEELVNELADLLEVFDALLTAHGIDYADVLARQIQRREQRGGFTKRLKLLWTGEA